MNKRPPDIYYYNPTCEYAVGNANENWQPNRLLQKLEDDLSQLPLFFASKNDYIILKKLPSISYIESLKTLGIPVPEFILKTQLSINNFEDIEIGYLKPWGWSPVTHKFLSSLKSNCSPAFIKSPVYNWMPEHRNLVSREFALNVLKALLKENRTVEFIPDHLIPKVCRSKPEIEEVIHAWGKIMVKAPWSSSGRGLQPITKTPVHQKVWEKIIGMIKEQGFVIAEPLLNKALDLSIQFQVSAGKISSLGTSYFFTNSKGQYEGNWLNGLPDSVENEVKQFAGSIIDLATKSLSKILKLSDLAKYYEGEFGVDMLIYRNNEEKLCINPCLEINVRHTMGLLSICLEKLIQPDKRGVFKIHYHPEKSFHQFKIEMERKYPLEVKNSKIQSGFFPLIDSDESTIFGAYILVE